MGAIPKYNGVENLRRIKMQKSTTFVVVEGVDDVPIYESCLSHMAQDCSKYDIVFTDGKTAIREFLLAHQAHNAIFIIDRDFQDIEIEDPRLVTLDRYSIENYFICSQVISHSLKFALNCKFKDAFDAFDLSEFSDFISAATEELIKAIYYYQKVLSKNIEGERPAWSDTFLCENSSWHLCNAKIDELVRTLLPTAEAREAADEYYQANFDLPGSAIENFPGKMLKVSLQRYIKQQVLKMRPSAKGKYSDVETTRELLSAVIHKSDEIARILTPVVEFIRGREAQLN
ncbi:DUF4435 domain-containing protein [Pseudomonas sp. NPDC089758]|uniref:DUF4435 domain-containing protein n=1 Tax=Pseudomonas sp. NPDC089758 TaxID=3364473 RepID=UPI00380E52D1